MKATLEFNLPKDQEAFDLCASASQLRGVISSFGAQLKGLSEDANNEDDERLFTDMRNLLTEELQNRGLNHLF